MAVTKRLRYEVLRRDNHTCRYCGATPPDVKLTVDHVTPVALGGTDEPANLVAACADCNAGKSSTSPDDALVEDVSQDALRWAKAMERAAEMQEEERDLIYEWRKLVHDEWTTVFSGHLVATHDPSRGWHYRSDPDRTYAWAITDYVADPDKVLYLADTEQQCRDWAKERRGRLVPPLPSDWDASIHHWLAAGLDIFDIGAAMETARDADHVYLDDKFRYFCGVVWRSLEDRQAIAQKLLQDGGA